MSRPRRCPHDMPAPCAACEADAWDAHVLALLEAPVHLQVAADDRRTICGIDAKTAAALPLMLVRHVAAHRAGHAKAGRPFVLCPDCGRAL